MLGLNVTNQVAAHCDILSRSVFRFSAAIIGLSTIIKILVSSANSRMFNKKSKGPKIDPCGTPARVNFHSDTVPGRTTRCFLSAR